MLKLNGERMRTGLTATHGRMETGIQVIKGLMATITAVLAFMEAFKKVQPVSTATTSETAQPADTAN